MVCMPPLEAHGFIRSSRWYPFKQIVSSCQERFSSRWTCLRHSITLKRGCQIKHGCGCCVPQFSRVVCVAYPTQRMKLHVYLTPCTTILRPGPSLLGRGALMAGGHSALPASPHHRLQGTRLLPGEQVQVLRQAAQLLQRHLAARPATVGAGGPTVAGRAATVAGQAGGGGGGGGGSVLGCEPDRTLRSRLLWHRNCSARGGAARPLVESVVSGTPVPCGL